ncbi:hypothetical protein [Mycolicibacterium sphagni]|uniref:hypothetical protein n=1 Tax=Mycolicibacterium sphagni TaxID=1786 RepID=UPI0021F3AE34|nr:hypothetical protein [Mycolicibacterium sphagni]MCV7174932.1 hypothetical protein [Mycolicibacterium sphagni]
MAVDTAVTWPAGSTSTSMGRAPYFTNVPIPFAQLPQPLQGMGTHMVYIDPSGELFDIAGPRAGTQGARVSKQFYGDQQWPFDQVLSNSPYIVGATIERQNIPERKFNMGIVIGHHNPPMTEMQYRMAESHWFAGQDETQDGWLGVYTRFSGWRWIPVRPDTSVKTPLTIDPTAYGNNVSEWDVTWLAARPYFTKPALYRTFQSKLAGAPKPPSSNLLVGDLEELIGDTFYTGTLPLSNRGDLPSFASFYVSSPGQAILQDNQSTRMVPMPITGADVGTYMVDTEPGHRTLTAANDPQDNAVFDLIRQSRILDYFLSGIANEGIPLQLQWNNRFIYMIPPKTEVQITVSHSDISGEITAVVPQRFKLSR